MAAPTQASVKSSISSGMQGVQKKFIGAVEDAWQLYSDRAVDYTLGSIIGFGASSIVYTALYNPPGEKDGPPPTPIPCALKVLDLDKLPPHALSLLQRETTLMSLSKHPNVIRVRGSWMDGHKLYIAMRLMNKGSAADVMHYGWPGGMEEEVVKCILKQTLQGLNYLHINGFIHRDVKAANLLIDDDGTVLLGDLGVAADLTEDQAHPTSKRNITSATAALSYEPGRTSTIEATASTSSSNKHVVLVDAVIPPRPRIGKRKSFVGTPCWMAPELIQGRQYDSSADIWSFGITALELSQGRPPRARETPQKVLMRTIQEDPPTLDREGGTYKYSRAFKEMVDSCLVKDPTKRPTAEQLLQTPFFKSSKKPSYLVGAILKDLPPLTQRQERRLVQTVLSQRTIDSWDFATTIHSPQTSIYRHRLRLDDDELPDSAASIHSRHSSHDRHSGDSPHDSIVGGGSIKSKRHLKGISWEAPVAEDERELASSSPSSPSDRSGFQDMAGSNSQSATPSSPTSSVSVLEEHKPAEERPPEPESEPEIQQHSTVTAKPLPAPSAQTTPIPIPRPPPSSFPPQRDTGGRQNRPSSSQGTASSPSSSPSQKGGIWRKIKSNFRRPSTQAGYDSSSSGSPRASLFDGASARLEAVRLSATNAGEVPLKDVPEKTTTPTRRGVSAARPSTATRCDAHDAAALKCPKTETKQHGSLSSRFSRRRPCTAVAKCETHDHVHMPVGEYVQKPGEEKKKVGSRFGRRASTGKLALATVTTRTAQAVGLMK
ncbi:hypothetical protein HGRIS_007545 [Hohenbuehelia grisea]|uniref:Protein kinase domain-containing protein n=1 Tax=Hohenbuehelia grisea TaxID=104357 RepID=A0ABR3J567_9AGAR